MLAVARYYRLLEQALPTCLRLMYQLLGRSLWRAIGHRKPPFATGGIRNHEACRGLKPLASVASSFRCARALVVQMKALLHASQLAVAMEVRYYLGFGSVAIIASRMA